MNHRTLTLAAFLVATAALTAVEIAFSRIDGLRHLALTAPPPIASAPLDLAPETRQMLVHAATFDRDLALCRSRTESLHQTLEVLLGSGVWPRVVALPDPSAAGWKPWPKMNLHGFDPHPETP